MKIFEKNVSRGAKGYRANLKIGPKRDIISQFIDTSPELPTFKVIILYKHDDFDIERAINEVFANRSKWTSPKRGDHCYALKEQQGIVYLNNIIEREVQDEL